MKKPRADRRRKDEERPITAQPIGSTFASQSHGERENRRHQPVGYFADGCYRRMPTCKE